jgi:hypothetical protein
MTWGETGRVLHGGGHAAGLAASTAARAASTAASAASGTFRTARRTAVEPPRLVTSLLRRAADAVRGH